MKTKFIAALALALWLAVTGWLATMVVAKPAVLHLGYDAEETMEMAQLRLAIERNRAMQAQIATLRPRGFIGTERSLVALPVARPAAADTGMSDGYGYGAALSDEAPAALDVTMVMNTDGRRSAIVDGQYVRAGSRLSDGSRIRAIGSDRVRIQRPDGVSVDRPVRSPFATGGAQ